MVGIVKIKDPTGGTFTFSLDRNGELFIIFRMKGIDNRMLVPKSILEQALEKLKEDSG
jgi:hypothetical protein